MGELGSLRRGAGLRRADLIRTLPPGVLAALDPPADETAEQSFRRLVALLRRAATQMAAQQRECFLACLAITDDAISLVQREQRIANLLKITPRTVRRRLQSGDERAANTLLELIRRRARLRDEDPGGWHVLSMRSVLHLDRPKPQFVAERRIRIGRHALNRLTDRISVPISPGSSVEDGVEVECLRGGRVENLNRLTRSVWTFDIALDSEAPAGSMVLVELVVTFPGRHSVQPYNIVVPLRAYESFTASVFFGETPVDKVWSVQGLPQAVLVDPDPTGPLLEVGSQGAVEVDFDRLQPGCAYGLQWSWPSQ